MALEGVQPVAQALTELLVDPAGHQWTLVYDADDVDLRNQLTAAVDQQLESGAFGEYYRTAFAVEPNYDLEPRLQYLLNGLPSCLS